MRESICKLRLLYLPIFRQSYSICNISSASNDFELLSQFFHHLVALHTGLPAASSLAFHVSPPICLGTGVSETSEGARRCHEPNGFDVRRPLFDGMPTYSNNLRTFFTPALRLRRHRKVSFLHFLLCENIRPWL